METQPVEVQPPGPSPWWPFCSPWSLLSSPRLHHSPCLSSEPVSFVFLSPVYVLLAKELMRGEREAAGPLCVPRCAGRASSREMPRHGPLRGARARAALPRGAARAAASRRVSCPSRRRQRPANQRRRPARVGR